MTTEAAGASPDRQLREALAQLPRQLQRSGLEPAQARVCLTIVEANPAEEPHHRHVEHVWAIATEGWVHAYDIEAQHWYSWARECVHWIEWT